MAQSKDISPGHLLKRTSIPSDSKSAIAGDKGYGKDISPGHPVKTTTTSGGKKSC